MLGDVVVPVDDADAVTRLEAGVDRPDTVADLAAWLRSAGLEPELRWSHQDLAVLAAAFRS